jgi:hypothetical protein
VAEKQVSSRPPATRGHHLRRLVAHWSRVLHTYLSMASFAILFFFAATGITLNHQDRMNGEPKVSRFSGKFDVALVAPSAGAQVDQSRIVGQLRGAHHIKAQVSDFRADDDMLTVSFKGPGYAADAFIDRRTATYEVTETRMGFVAIINDLHKGRDTGAVWAQVIDLSAVLMMLVSVTGLTLIFFLHKRFALGMWLLAIGSAISLAVYGWFVP